MVERISIIVFFFSLGDLSCGLFVCMVGRGGKGKEMSKKKKKRKKKEMTRRDSPNSSNPLTVSMVGAARTVLLK